jgi:hypothetical protein
MSLIDLNLNSVGSSCDNQQATLIEVKADDSERQGFEWKTTQFYSLGAPRQVVVPDVHEASGCADGNAFEAWRQCRNFITVVCKHAEVEVTAPEQNFPVLMACQENMAFAIHVLLQHGKKVVAVVCYDRQSTDRRSFRVV